MKLVLETQYRENYGDEENPHWKAKGGQTYIVTDENDSPWWRVDIEDLRNLIDYENSMSEESVISVHMEEDDYCSDYEKWQKEDDMSVYGIYYDTRITFHEDGAYVATDQFKGPRGEFVKTWKMLPGGEKENYSYTETLTEAI